MIVFDLECREGHHRFEGWFASSEDFASQQGRGLVSCPHCGSAEVIKAPMAPNLARTGNQLPQAPARGRGASPASPAAPAVASPPESPPASMPPPLATPSPESVALMRAMAAAQAEALKASRWVGGKFAEKARAMHYGEQDAEPIHGQATPDEARALIDEGVEVAPILFSIAPPGEVN